VIVPSYAELSARRDGPPGSSWNVFTTDPERGMANFAGTEQVRGAANVISTGEVFSLDYALNAFDPVLRRDIIYWLALAALVGLLGGLFLLLRSRAGAAIQAIRDNEEAAASLGVRVTSTKRLIFVLAAFGVGLAGSLWLATALTFQPKAFFSVQWTAYMIFMVLVGGIGTFEGAILGAVLFFAIETWFGAAGVWYLVGLGATALIFALALPRGIWGAIERRTGLRLLPVGYRLDIRLPVVGK